MTHDEPSSLEVLITIAVGNLFGSVYKTAVDSLNLAGSERVLDFGSGAGMPARLIAGRLAEGGGALTCVDVSKAWIKTAQKHVQGYPNVAFLLGEISELDIPDESHDVVFIHFVIHDIPASQRLQVVKHLAYKLVKGGRLYIREPLNVIARDEIDRLMKQNGLEELRSTVDKVPPMGPAYEGIFEKGARPCVDDCFLCWVW
jgi:ubiquinone/menaquinone biosynthesis C-methylase UbiE